MAIKKRTDQLPAILSGDVDNNDLMYLVHENAQAETGYDSKKILVSDVGRKLNNGVEYATELPSFPPGEQNPLDALEYLNSKINDLYPVDSASGSLVNFTTSLAMPLVALKAYIQALGGGGTPQDENPIIGFDKINLYQRGVNLWDEDWEVGSIDETTGENLPNTTTIRSKNLIPVKPNTSFYLKITTATFVGGRLYKADGSYIGTQTINANATITLPDNCCFLRFVVPAVYGTTYNNDISINYPSTDTSYHAYNPNSTEYTIQLGQTVYGAYAEKSTGKLVINSAIVDLGTLANWSYDSTNQRFYSWNLTSTIKAPPSNSQTIYMLCSAYSVYALGSLANYGIAVSTTKNIYIKNTDYDNTTINDFIASLSGVKLVYELAVPIETDITIPDITALVGENNIFADTGNIDVSFKMGVQEYIDKKIAEVQALVL